MIQNIAKQTYQNTKHIIILFTCQIQNISKTNSKRKTYQKLIF